MKKLFITFMLLAFALPVFSQNVTEEWVQRYNGIGNGNDVAKAMTVDAAGNVYVTGIAYIGVSPWFQGVIIKYDTSGDVVWEVTNDSIFPNLISIDALGNVYVTGGSYIGTFSTTKYNGDGIRQWSQDHTGNGSLEKPVAMTVDAAGNVYVTGESYGDTTQYDFLTIKISSAGNLLWAQTHNGPINRDDRVSAIAVDGAGNVFVSGTIRVGNNNHLGTIKYSSSGTFLWERTWLGTDYTNAYGSDLTLDNSGNVYITGTGKGPSNTPFIFWWKYVTLKYSSGGTLLWTQIYEGVGGLNCDDDWGNAITSDELGNVYVTGGSMPNNCKTEIATIKYNSAGGVQWIARFVDPDGEDNEGYFITVDNSGNVYVTGSDFANKILSVKYNSTGQLQWHTKYISPVSGGYAYSVGIGVDANENLYVAGASDGVGTGRDFVTIKYSEEEIKRRPVFIVPGIAGTYAANTQNDINWIMTRGIHPDSTQIDPIGKFYHDIIITLENEGYVQNKDLFVVNYDWRLPPGPVDGNIDGHISGISASGISNNNFDYAVDYLGWYMKKACEIWRQNHDEELDSIDIISHSTGGLVTRTYIQSDAYNSVYDNVNGYRLPRIKNFIMVGVPNRGASKAWNVLHDNWSGDIAYRLVLSKIVNRAFQKLIKGQIITGPEGNITYESILDENGKPDKKLFIMKYVPTARYLLATYSFINFGSGLTDVNDNPDIRNTIILDLNNGFDIDPLNDPNGFLDSANVTVIYGNGVNTATTTNQKSNFAFAVLQSFTQVVPWNSFPPNIWFDDISISNNGDGTVPTTSSANQFLIDPRPSLYSFSGPDHTGLVGNVNVQTTILNVLDVDFNPSNISLGSSKDLKLAVNILFKSVLVDLGFNRPGNSSVQYKSRSSFTDDPDVVWFGEDTDGMVYIFDEVSQTLNIQLTGTGEDFYVMVGYNDSTSTDGIVLEGYLDVGETVSYQFEVSEYEPMDVAVTSIASPSPDQILKSSGSVISAYVTNFGNETVDNCNVYYTIDGKKFGPVKVQTSIAPNDSAIVTFQQAFRLRSQVDLSNVVLTVFTENAADTNMNNDSVSLNVSLFTPVTDFPYIENFNDVFSFTTSGAVALWSLNAGKNPSGTINDTMYRAGYFTNASGESVLRTPLIDLSLLSNPILSFYMSYTSNLLLNDDGLEVMVSTNGGVTFNTPLYSKSFLSQPSLATVSPQSDEFVPANTNQWRYLMFDLTPYAGQEIVIGFKATSAGGNNLWIDNLKIAKIDEFELIAVNGAGLYGNLLNSGIQLNITGFSSSRVGSKSNNTPDASSGDLAISKVNDFPDFQTVQTNITATTFSGAIFTPDVISDKFWDVSFTGDDYNSYATYDFVIDISSQLGIVDADRIYVLKRKSDNDEWECLSTITEYEAGLSVKVIAQNQSGFGQFAFGTDDGTLPVDLVEFSATVDRNNVTLNWTTAWEENNMKFDVQRRPVILSGSEESIWNTVGSVTGSGSTQEQKSYSFLDRNLITGKYEYRLVQIDFDGNSTSDHTLSSQVEVGIPTEFALSQNYPNPFNPATKIDFQIPIEGMVRLSIFDMSGREVATLVNESLTAGYYTYTFNGANFSSGVYFYRLVSSNSVITKRAVLVK